ncbi:hypothetical protein C8R43DRAFT_957590 [Mycena crocata]|nr:hypothetical protein C8R43DRAFT_957590 [Mycena crocata]
MTLHTAVPRVPAGDPNAAHKTCEGRRGIVRSRASRQAVCKPSTTAESGSRSRFDQVPAARVGGLRRLTIGSENQNLPSHDSHNIASTLHAGLARTCKKMGQSAWPDLTPCRATSRAVEARRLQDTILGRLSAVTSVTALLSKEKQAMLIRIRWEREREIWTLETTRWTLASARACCIFAIAASAAVLLPIPDFPVLERNGAVMCPQI